MASPEDRRVRCARCRTELSSLHANSVGASGSSTENGQPLPRVSLGETAHDSAEVPNYAFFEQAPFDLNSWRWDEDLEQANRVIRTWGRPSSSEMPPLSPTARLPHPYVASPSVAPASLSTPAPKRAPVRSTALSILAWLSLSLGMMAFVFGGVLLGWSVSVDRPELWQLGLPFALGGQVGLVLGLVMLLDGLWRSNRDATESLQELDEQLAMVRRATSQLSSTHSGPGQSFYFHLAEGCSPHMLLADLKGQLDLLALRIADDK